MCIRDSHRLVIIIGERVGVRELLEIGRVAVGDVIVARGDVAFLQERNWRWIRERCSVAARGDGNLNPREEIGLASRWIAPRGLRRVAVELLPHLIEAMHRAAAIGVVEALASCCDERINATRQIAVPLSLIHI